MNVAVAITAGYIDIITSISLTVSRSLWTPAREGTYLVVSLVTLQELADESIQEKLSDLREFRVDDRDE